MSAAVQVCDGWDVRRLTADGGAVTLHFRTEPTEAQVAAALASYAAASAPKPEPEPAYSIECEDGTYA